LALRLGTGAGVAATAGAVLVATMMVGLYVERTCFTLARRNEAVTSMVASFAVWMQIEEATTLAFPRHSCAFPGLPAAGMIELGAFALRSDRLAAAGIALTLALILHRVIFASKGGRAMRALAQSPAAARLVGIPVERIRRFTFLLSSAVGGIAGLLIASVDQQVTPMFGMWATAKGLVAMMLGGLGSLSGAIVGGLALGLAEAIAQEWLGPQQRDLVALLLLLLVLFALPGGLVSLARPLRTATTMRRRSRSLP
jgi:branched-subunit amino acid ABC-type transport system permease component